MSKKGIVILVVLVLVGGFAAWFFLEGRFMVEGGRAPWAVINEEPEVLKEAIKEGLDAEELSSAMGRAVGRGNLFAMGILAKAGASPDPDHEGCYIDRSIRWGRVKVARLLLEQGADLKRCKTDLSAMMTNAIVFGSSEVPQDDIIAVLSYLLAAGGKADAKGGTSKSSPLDAARKQKLEKVLAYLQNPGDKAVASASGGEAQPRGKAGSLSMDDLKKVCAGEAQSDAASYVKQASNTSKLYYFEKRYEDWRWPGRGPGMPELPAWWTDFKEPANTQLVVCVDLTDKTKVQDCRYKGGGDGISAYEATITLTLYESKTGRKVDTSTFKKGAPTCPVVKMGRKQEGLFPPYSKELKTFLAPHVGGPT